MYLMSFPSASGQAARARGARARTEDSTRPLILSEAVVERMRNKTGAGEESYIAASHAGRERALDK